MKIVLAPVYQITKGEPLPLYGCLGVLTLAAGLKKRNFNCDIIDLVNYSNLDNLDFEPLAMEIAGGIAEREPDILGLSTTSDSLVIALELSRHIRKVLPDVCLVLGGPGVSYCAQEVITRFPFIDYVIRGEADYAFPDFVAAYCKNEKSPQIKGLVYLCGNRICDYDWPDPVSNLDDLPIPAYEFCQSHEKENLWFDNHFGFVIEAGRGCPYDCTFCSTAHYFKRKYRVKSADRIIAEIDYVRNIARNKRIKFNHDLLTFSKKYIDDLCRALSRNPARIRWGCNSRLDTIDHEMLQKMSQAGCDYIYFGIEAATPRMQKVIGKDLDLGQLDSILKSLNQFNFEFVFSFVTGFQEETVEDIEALFSLALKSKSACAEKCLIQIHTLVLDSGAPLLKNNTHELIYDEDNSIIDASIPRHWNQMRDLIKLHPDIFPRYFAQKNTNIPEGSEIRHPGRYANFAYIIEEILQNSLVYAFRIAGNVISKQLINCLNETPLIVHNSLEKSDFSYLLENIRTKIFRLLEIFPDSAEIFNSIAKYEIAIFEVTQKKIPEYTYKLETYHTQEDILKIISNPDTNPDIKKNLHYQIVFWDESRKNIQSIEVPKELSFLMD